MSFLYQALIKEQQKEQQGTKPMDAASQPSEFNNNSAPSAGHGANFQPQPQANFSNMLASEPESKHHWFWLAIAGLLALVGLLGGYLFGSKDTNQALYSSIQQQTSQVQQQQQALAQNLADLKESTKQQVVPQVQAAAPAEPQVEAAVQSDKQIEVAVDKDGQVKTQVTDMAANTSSEPEQLVKRNILPEVAIEDIPDTLKSTFADAVKATEQEHQPELFEPQVTTGSSLPLLDELKLSEIYWVPDISYEMHIYASEPSERWIRINGKTLTEGEALIDKLVLLEIRQDQIIWQGNGRRFAQNALQDFVKK